MKSLLPPLTGGKRVVLYGPIGIGKSAILHEVAKRLRTIGCPYGLASSTATLHDITRALLQVYPEYDIEEWSQQRIRGRMKIAAENRAGVLLLDHFQDIGTASKGFLKQLWTLKIGILAAVDVEFPRDAARFRSLKMTDKRIEVPPLDKDSMMTIFETAAGEHPLPRPPDDKERRAILRNANGRPGWIKMMGQRAGKPRYWNDGRLLTGLLRIDVSSDIAGQYLGISFPKLDPRSSAPPAKVERGPV